jgi:hypothetical protein
MDGTSAFDFYTLGAAAAVPAEAPAPGRMERIARQAVTPVSELLSVEIEVPG